MKKYDELKNPYTLQFSYIPPQFIERTMITNEIISNYIREVPTYRGLFITGVRGAGKTVIMGYIRNKIDEMEDWITVDLNPEGNLLDSLARSLYLLPEIRALFVKARIDFSVLGIGVHLENANLVASNEEDAIKLMLGVLKTCRKKVLVTIDEITYSADVAKFSHALSSYAGADYDIYLLMTGLYENIKAIKNQKSLTFLYRAKVLELESLNITAIYADYRKVFELDREKAEELAYSTKGYSLAFQALGYHCWNEFSRHGSDAGLDWDDIYQKLDITLSELAYEKIWSELSECDRKVLRALCTLLSKGETQAIRVEDIRREVDMTSDTFTTYRKRLMEAGVVDGSRYGHLSLRLPRFENFVSMQI
jgi:predicted AAA+ superfamily ATPase